MKVIIYGASEFGYLIANEFYQQYDITVIDREENKSDEFDKLDISFINGSGADIDILRQADIKCCDVFIACTCEDETNIVSCVVAKKVSKAKTICFISQKEYKRTFEAIREVSEPTISPAIDSVIWPEELLTEEIFRLITVSKALSVENFVGSLW